MSNLSHTLAFNLQGPEIALIFLVVLLLFGAKKLPELARGIGKSTGEFKRARDDFEREVSRAEVKSVTETPKTTESEKTQENKEV